MGHRRLDKRKNLWERFVIDVISFSTGRLGEIVPAVSINDLVERYGWAESGIDFIKADMEGAEQVVFGDPEAAATWLKITKCFSIKLSDQPVQHISRLVEPRFEKAFKTGDMQVWCRADLVQQVLGGATGGGGPA